MTDDSYNSPKLEHNSVKSEQIIAELKSKIAAQQDAASHNDRVLRVLREFSLAIGSTVTVKELVHQVIESAINLVEDCKGGAIYLYNEKHEKLVMAEQLGLSRELVGRTLLSDEGLGGQVFQKGEPILVKDYARWDGHKVPVTNASALSALGVPLKEDHRTVGALILFTEKGTRPFQEDDLMIVEMLITIATIAYHSSTALERLEQELDERKRLEARERELRALAQTMFDITAILNASLHVDDVLDNMLANIHRIAPGDVVCLFSVADDIARAVRSRSSDQKLAEFLSRWSFNYLDHPVFAKMVLTHYPLIFSNEEDFVGTLQPQFKIFHSFIGSVIKVREKLIGFVFMGSLQPGVYHDEHIRRLQAFSNQSALAINNARLYEEVQSLAITDPLTGVYNRRGFLRFGRQEINRAMRFGRPLSMLFFDIDHFKAFNDRYSYEIGDEVLRKVAQVAQSTVRNVDLMGRYGGEEFIILVPEVTKEAAVLVAERLRMRVESLRLHTVYGDLGITISVGVASMNFPRFQTKPLDISEDDLLEGLIQRAGRTLRHAKESGRNRVSVQDDQGEFSTLN